MTRNITSKILALGVILVTGSTFAAPAVYTELSTANSFSNHSSNSMLYINVGYAINDRYSVTPEFLGKLAYREDGSNKATLSHEYLRVTASDKRLSQLGPWTVGIDYRYVLPTNAAMQAQGSFGALSFRPNLKATFGPVKVPLYLSLGVHLQRNAYEMNPASSGAGKGNPLTTIAFIATPEVELGVPGLTLQTEFVHSNTLNMPAQNTTNTTWTNKISQEWEVNYTSPAIADFAVGLGLREEAVYGRGATSTKALNLFTGATEYYLELAKVF